jgi:trypsin
MKIVTAVLLILLLAVVSAAADDSPKVLRGGPDPTTYGDHRKLQSQIINETYVPAQIINGTGAPVNRYPYTVSLQKGGSRHFCGGSLIAPDLVLTAAHCSVSLSDFARIVLNPHKLSDPIETSEVFSVEDYVIHPFYETLSLYDHDYMIIKLTGRSRIPTVRLSKNETLPVAGSSLQVLGWGTKVAGFEVAADTLQQVDVVTITNEECRKASDAYENGITPDSLCAAEVNKGACQGDSGGPLVIAGSSPEEDVQVGIVSWGVGCAEPERKLFRRSIVVFRFLNKSH